MGAERSDSLLSSERRSEVAKQVRERYETEALRLRAFGRGQPQADFRTTPEARNELIGLGALPPVVDDIPPKGAGKKAKAKAKAAALRSSASAGGGDGG